MFQNLFILHFFKVLIRYKRKRLAIAIAIKILVNQFLKH